MLNRIEVARDGRRRQRCKETPAVAHGPDAGIQDGQDPAVRPMPNQASKTLLQRQNRQRKSQLLAMRSPGTSGVPVAGAANETLVNGELVVAPQVLREGDVIAVGRKAAGIVKLPLTVSGLGG